MSATDEEWAALWLGIRELTEAFPDGLVFIGGVAVYLHAVNETHPEQPAGFVEFSHDGDFYISIADFGDLRALEEVTANVRLKKHQLIKHGIEFDVYLEHHSGLLVRYDDIQRYSVLVEDVRVASLEHLLILKTDAYRARRGTAKGNKDERDLIRILAMLGRAGMQARVLEPYLTEETVEVLGAIERSPEFMTICRGNAHAASRLRKTVAGTLKKIRKTLP